MRENCSSLLSSTGSAVLCVVLSCALTIAQPQDTPRDFASNHALGERYVQQHNYTAAERYLGAAYKLNPADEDNAFDLAQAELQTGDAATARNLLQTLLAHHDRPDFHNLLGDCEEALGDFHEAANQYQIAERAESFLLWLGTAEAWRLSRSASDHFVRRRALSAIGALTGRARYRSILGWPVPRSRGNALQCRRPQPLRSASLRIPRQNDWYCARALE